MRRIELIYDMDCPNVESARGVLRDALAAEGLEAEWAEWNRESGDSPEYAREYGSPTILVDGRDVSGQGSEADANCCRVYAAADGALRGVPEVETVRAALRLAGSSGRDP